MPATHIAGDHRRRAGRRAHRLRGYAVDRAQDLVGVPNRDKGAALLREVIASGVRFIDTADVYGPHSNEELIREALHPYPHDLVIATKGGFVRGGPSTPTSGRSGIRCTSAKPPT
jgi:aryl-alcohol dehydrogenase-like predicted oxidoreductase